MGAWRPCRPIRCSRRCGRASCLLAVEFHPEARAELLQERAWYRERSEQAALGFDTTLAAAVSLIAETPEVAPVWLPMAQRPVRKWALRRYPFCLFYVALDARLVILAVAHVRRRPGYWQSRLGT